MKRSHLFLIAGIVAVGVIALAVSFSARRAKKIAPFLPQEKAVPVKKEYRKGGAAFSYPAGWQVNDIPAAGDFISVQAFDAEDNIVFVASSQKARNDAKAGKPLYEKEITLDGVKGILRQWENEKSGMVVWRADNLQFANRYYRFEMFAAVSRKVKAERAWQDILDSVRFMQTENENIEAKPQAKSEK